MQVLLTVNPASELMHTHFGSRSVNMLRQEQIWQKTYMIRGPIGNFRTRTRSPVRANTPVIDPHVFSHHFAVMIAGKILENMEWMTSLCHATKPEELITKKIPYEILKSWDFSKDFQIMEGFEIWDFRFRQRFRDFSQDFQRFQPEAYEISRSEQPLGLYTIYCKVFVHSYKIR